MLPAAAAPIFALQPLESRRLLHAPPAGPHIAPPVGVGGAIGTTVNAILDQCPEVVEARDAVQAALHQLHVDRREGREQIAATRDAIMDEMRQLAEDVGHENVRDALAPLKEKLRADIQAQFDELRPVSEELRVAKRQGRQQVAAALEALREAHQSGDQAAIEAAQQELNETREQVQADLEPIRQEILSIHEHWKPIIQADHEAIESKLEELNPDLEPLFDQLDADHEALKEKLESGLAAVTEAQQALKTAIADCRDEHADGDHTA